MEWLSYLLQGQFVLSTVKRTIYMSVGGRPAHAHCGRTFIDKKCPLQVPSPTHGYTFKILNQIQKQGEIYMYLIDICYSFFYPKISIFSDSQFLSSRFG